MSGPSITSAGASTAVVLPSSPVGPGLRLNGSPDLGAFLIASYSGTAGSCGAVGGVTVTAAPGAAFIYFLRGSGTTPSGRQLRIQRRPGSSMLEAATSTGTVSCGTFPSGTPTHVTMVYRAATRRFDVFIGGAPSMCMDLQANLAPPVVGFSLMDASNDGWGGRVEFTNLSLF